MSDSANEYKPIPVSAAKLLGLKYEKDIVIIAGWDQSRGILHVTTAGGTPEQITWARQGGELVREALGALGRWNVFEDEQARTGAQLLAALKALAAHGGEHKKDCSWFADEPCSCGWEPLKDRLDLAIRDAVKYFPELPQKEAGGA